MIEKNNEVMKLFENFWDLYPRKVGKAKCIKKFSKICKKPDTGKEIIEGIKKYNSIYKTRARKFIPYPSTWLSEERWKDDIEAEYEEIF